MGLIGYLASGDSRKSLKKLDKMALEVEKLEPKYQKMTDAELKSQTAVFKERLAKGETLDDIMYDAFAALREASWRVLGMKHFHVQIIGGICLFQGRIAEMKTGEGKTLVATLPSYLEALSGRGVHIVTVNDYLARRDAEWMGKVHKFMGLTVGVVVPGLDDDYKRQAYQCDITYGTNNEFGFDYLRDNLKSNLKLMVQRELNFAIVDEVDSILIDEARTPLIISGKGEQSSALYEEVDKFVRTLSGGFDDDMEEEQNKNKSKRRQSSYDSDARKLAKAEELKWDYVIERKDKQVHLTEFGAEKAEQFFHVDNVADISNLTLNHHIQQALKAHKLFHRDEQYMVINDEIIIVDEFTGRQMIGRRYSDGLHQAIEAKEGVKVREENKTFATITFQNYFRLYRKLSGMTGTAKTEEGEFRTIYSLDVIEIPTNRPVRRIDYHDRIFSTEEGKKKAIVREIVERHEKGQPILVGTVSVEKSEELSRLLRRNGIQHNILNAKNHEREAEIVAQAGGFGAVTISTNMAGRGTDILLGGNPEYLAKKRLREEGVEHETIELATSYAEVDEETLAVRERYQKLYQHYKEKTDDEKKKVIEAGGLCIIGTERHEARRIDNQLRGRAGRQGDIGASIFFISLEDDLMKRFGGEKMKMIYERSKMQEDECLEAKMLSRLIEYAQKQIEGKHFGARKNVLQYDDVMNQQRKLIYAERMKVLRGEDVHEQILKYIPDYVESIVRDAVNAEVSPDKWDEGDLNAALEKWLLPVGTNYVTREKLEKWDYPKAISKISERTEKAYEEKIVRLKEEAPQVNFADIERQFLLNNVDRNWIDHIDAMDQLRKGIGLRAYGQNDPVIAYKQEGSAMFNEMIERIQTNTVRMLLKVQVEIAPRPITRIMPTPSVPQEQPSEPRQQAPSLPVRNEAQAMKNVMLPGMAIPTAVDVSALKTSGNEKFNPASLPKKKKVGPNDPCPCGSGLKYKKCHGKPF